MAIRESILRSTENKEAKLVKKNRGRSNRFNELILKDYKWKRVLDLILATLGLVPLMILSPILFIGIKLSSRGPIFYKQRRTGQHGKPFIVLKVRTMHMYITNKKDDKPALTQKRDPRVFKFGSLLRKSNLDELPQLFNVLKGEMSLVGPRPYMDDECNYWDEKFDDFYNRYSVKPGITGLAQVKGYRGGTFDEVHMRRRLDWDLIYVEKQSLWLDLKLIFGTVFQMLHFNTNAH